MNNSQFRKLVLETPSRPVEKSTKSDRASTSRNGAAAVPALGSRARSSIPMTPRSIAGLNYSAEFSRQVAERNSASSHSEKKFRSSAAPKGAKLPAGYLDRAKSRLNSSTDETDNNKVERINALEEMIKLNQIDELTFTKLRDEILGDESGAKRAGLVKGLDWGLLERARKGEVDAGDILEDFVEKKPEENEENQNQEDIDKEFEDLEKKEVQAVAHEVTKKKGEMAPPSLTGKKKTRDQILAELKASRQSAAQNVQPRLGSKFKRVGDPKSQSRIEKDNKGREILITTDENGNIKRKVRKILQDKLSPVKSNKLLMPDKDAKPLGMEVPDVSHLTKKEEEDILDIFDGVGDDYDPLAGLDEDDNSEDEEIKPSSDNPPQDTVISSSETRPKDKTLSPSCEAPQPSRRNYFNSHISEDQATKDSSNSDTRPPTILDPATLAALKKAALISQKITSSEHHSDNMEESSAEAALRAKEARYRRMLQQDDRDAQDLDLGFGSSRLEDDVDADEGGIKRSKWGEINEGSKNNSRSEGKGKRNRNRGSKRRTVDEDDTRATLTRQEKRTKTIIQTLIYK